MKGCINTNVACKEYIPGKCVYYSGKALKCSGVIYNDSIDLALQKLDTKVCNIIGNTAYTSWTQLQMLIGDPSSLMQPGDDQFIIYDPAIVIDSIWISLDGHELPRDIADRQSYVVLFEQGRATINFNFEAEEDMLYIFHYGFNSSMMNNVSFAKIQFKIGTPSSPMLAGETDLTVFDLGVFPDTITVVAGGIPLPENSSGLYDDQFSYIYEPVVGGFNLSFNSSAYDGQDYIITYAKNVTQ